MDPELCAAFIRTCTGDNCSAQDNRIKNLFEVYDTDKDGILMEENFIEFYSQASKGERQ